MSKATLTLSDLADAAIQRSFSLAQKHRNSLCEPEHLLLGLLELSDGASATILAEAHVDCTEIRKRIESSLPPKANFLVTSIGAASPRWKDSFAVLHAAFPSAPTIGTDHLLFASIAVLERPGTSSLMPQYLENIGLTSAAIKPKVGIRNESVSRTSPIYDTSRMRLTEETAWTKQYEIEPRHLFIESKFSTGEAKIDAATLKESWPRWNLREKIDFINSYQSRGIVEDDSEDQRVIRFLSDHAAADERRLVAWMLAHQYRARDEAFERLTQWASDPATASRSAILREMASLDIQKTLPMLTDYFALLLKQIDLDRLPREVSDNILEPYDECAWCSHTLYEMTEDNRYKDILTKLSKLPNRRIKAIADSCLRAIEKRH